MLMYHFEMEDKSELIEWSSMIYRAVFLLQGFHMQMFSTRSKNLFVCA